MILPALVGPQAILGHVVAVAFLLVLLLVPLWIFVGRAVLAPLRALSEAMERAVPGEGGAVIPAKAFPRNELGRVMDGWNQTLRRLGEQSARLVGSWEAVEKVLRLMAASATPEERVLQVALEVLTRAVGARYGAMHVLDEHGGTVAFLHTGLTEEEERRLAGREPPRGLGLLGILQEGQVIRLEDLARDPRHRGFGPEGHPPMRSFLGVPVASRDKVYGRIYLTEKAGGPFTEDDERLALTVARSLAVAVESMRAARRVHAVERLSRRILASLPDAVIVLGRGGEVRYANRVFYDWFGGEPSAVVGRSLCEVLPPAEAARKVEEIITGTARTNPFEAIWDSGEGEERTFRITVSGLRVAEEEEEEEEEELVIFEELTAYRRMAEKQGALEAQLLQAEKLSALGGLVSGVAHELNNPLTVILGRADLLLRREVDERVRRALETVRAQGDRMKRIIQHMLAVARKHPSEQSWVDLNALLRDTVELRVHQMHVNNIEARWHLDEALPRIFADPHQLGQVFLNLVTNAEHAMAGRPGVLTISTEHAGETVRVGVADTGSGIAPEHLPRIFDPFFTTKEVGRGTGLGLSVSYGIVTGHGGRILAESTPGGGASFFVELPLVTEGAVETAELPPAPIRPASGRDILIVDDEAEVRDVLAELLELDGHRVEAVGSGEEALARLRQRRYDVILTDIRMPGLDGPALYRRLAAEQPELLRRVIFVTGDTASAQTQGFLEETRLPHVAKPVALEALRQTVAQVCGAAGASDSA